MEQLTDLESLSANELFSLRSRVQRALDNVAKREKLAIYSIQTSDDLEHCFKKKKAALDYITEQVELETGQSDILFSEEFNTKLWIRFIDKVEYEKMPDSWLYVG